MRSLPDPGFAGDEGAADPLLASALREYRESRAAAPVLSALCRSRLLVPVVALPDRTESGPDGLARDKSAEVAAVFMQGRDGRRALLAFSSVAAMRSWDATARPVPVAARDAARAARSEDAEALLVDVAGPAMFVVEGDDLRELAAGHRLVSTSAGYAWLAAG